MTQLPLSLGHRPALADEDFLVAPGNAEAHAWLARWPDWPGPGLVLFGPQGCGKSHLLAAFAARRGTAVVSAASLDTATVPELLGGRMVVVIDDLNSLRDEAALFHLYNLVREAGRHLLLASREPPARLPIRLPDLRSRLNALPAVGIGAPDDALLAAVMVKLFADRQVAVGEEVVAYLLGRIERSFAAVGEAVDALDRAALAGKRAITVPLARTITVPLARAVMEEGATRRADSASPSATE